MDVTAEFRIFIVLIRENENTYDLLFLHLYQFDAFTRTKNYFDTIIHNTPSKVIRN